MPNESLEMYNSAGKQIHPVNNFTKIKPLHQNANVIPAEIVAACKKNSKST